MAAMKRKRISLPITNEILDADSCSTSGVAEKGHFVVYSADRKRFEFPLVYLNNEIFRELLQVSEEEFGIKIVGPIILPFDSVFMDYTIPFIQHGVAKHLEKALIISIDSSYCSSSSYFHQEQNILKYCNYSQNFSLDENF